MYRKKLKDNKIHTVLKLNHTHIPIVQKILALISVARKISVEDLT